MCSLGVESLRLMQIVQELLRVEEEKPKKKLKKAAADKPQGRPRPRVDRGRCLTRRRGGNGEGLLIFICRFGAR